MFRFGIVLALCALSLAAQGVKIVVQDPATLKSLQASGDLPSGVRLVSGAGDALQKEIADADAFVGASLPPDAFRAAKKLRWVQCFSAGVERMLFLSGNNLLRDSNIVLTNNKVVEGPELADHAFAMLLALTRQLPAYIAHRQNGTWDRNVPGNIIELKDKTAVVVGVGGAGFNIATRAWAFGMNVIGVETEDHPYTPIVKRYVKPDQLDEVLPEADVVFIAAPDTERSHKMIGGKQFDLMKKGAYFIVVSRGGLYEMDGLVRSLDSKKLAGAGVDVTDPEPLPNGHPLWKFENAIITPHVAGRSDMDNERMVGTVRENIKRFVAGKPLVNVVDKMKGY